MTADGTYVPLVYHQLGGDRVVVASGGSLDVESGGEIDVESGGSLKIAGTALTTTAAELNKLAGVTAGTVTASKAVVVGANKNIDTLVIADSGLYLGSGAGTAVTATAAELNKLASVTAGTITASKGVVVGSSKEVNEWTVTNGVLTETQTVSTAALGTVRGVYGKVTASHAAIASGLVTGVRGEITLSGTNSAGGAYFYGTQGKLIVTGTMNHADSRLCGLMAQLDISSCTLTTGQLSALWVDAGGTATGAGGGQFNLIRVQNTTAATPNAQIFMYGKASFGFDLYANGGGWCSSGGTPGACTGATGWIKIQVEGATRYIPLADSAS